MAAGDLSNIIPTHPSDSWYRAQRTTKILYKEPNGTEHNIKEIWYCDSSGTRHLIWQLPSSRVLMMDTSGYVLMKYTPTNDVNVSTVGIFTTYNGDNGKCVFIFNSEGILIAKGNQESKLSTTKYGLEGFLRTITIDPSFALTGGKTYWIAYYFQNADTAADSYFQNETGSYKRIGFTNSGATPQPSYKDSNIIRVNTSTYANQSPEQLDYILKNASYNDLIGTAAGSSENFEWSTALWKMLRNDTYYGMVRSSSNWDITYSMIENIPVNNTFILLNQYFGYEYVKLTAKDTSSQTFQTEVISSQADRTTKIYEAAINESSLINLNSAQTQVDRLHYLEINGNEIPASERS